MPIAMNSDPLDHMMDFCKVASLITLHLCRSPFHSAVPSVSRMPCAMKYLPPPLPTMPFVMSCSTILPGPFFVDSTMAEAMNQNEQISSKDKHIEKCYLIHRHY
jgi:hypothetical protein